MDGMSDAAHTRAIEEIKQLKARYFRCMDTKDWAGYLNVFTPDAKIDSKRGLHADRSRRQSHPRRRCAAPCSRPGMAFGRYREIRRRVEL